MAGPSIRWREVNGPSRRPGKNLLNKTYALPSTYVPSIGYDSVTYNRARQFLFSVRWNFL